MPTFILVCPTHGKFEYITRETENKKLPEFCTIPTDRGKECGLILKRSYKDENGGQFILKGSGFYKTDNK